MKPNPMHRGLVPEKGESDLLPNELKVAWSRKAAMTFTSSTPLQFKDVSVGTMEKKHTSL